MTTPRRRFALLVALAVAILASGCASDDTPTVASAGDLGHIHDLALDENGNLLVASHTGLYRIENETRAVLVGAQHDLMSMTVLPDGDILASGHPNLLLDEFRVEDRPPFLGLARSTDGGQNWDELDLLGEADFHALVPAGDGLFAAETSGNIWYQDPNAGWSTLGAVEARDLAIDPSDPQQQLAPDYDGTVWTSEDGAMSWTPSTEAPALIEIEWTEADVILGVTEAGSVWSAQNPAGPWIEIATSPTDVETFYVDASGSWWISVHGGEISRSDDQGGSWTDAYVPPGLD
jgi:ligand-binding sensor domain-containing protein